MGKKRVIAGYGIDVDVVAGHINKTDGSRPNTSDISRGSLHTFTTAFGWLIKFSRRVRS